MMNSAFSRTVCRRALLRSGTRAFSVRTTSTFQTSALAPLSGSSPDARCFSSTTGSTSSYNPLEWWKNRQMNKEAEKFKERAISMSLKDQFTLTDFSEELAEATGWKSKIPGVSSTKEVKKAKELKAVIESLIKQKGKDATDIEIDELSKLERLRAASAAEVTLADVDQFVEQFGNMCTIQKVLRQRHLEGRSIPLTQEKLMFVVQAEGHKHMSQKQKDQMRQKAKKKFPGMAG